LPDISEEEAATIVHSELDRGLSQRKIHKLISKSRITDLRNRDQHSYVSARRLFWVIRELQAVADSQPGLVNDINKCCERSWIYLNIHFFCGCCCSISFSFFSIIIFSCSLVSLGNRNAICKRMPQGELPAGRTALP
jgi:hypothetical protein